ncbi:RNA polymerase sigma factor [Nonomuraea sp. NPDC050328]|uniref:RNA polymerase sigma factor n=1 Tax=Nonomuraea sp. NPDC050328 TaxID=3364361 RepID=UPI00378E6FD5
MSQAVPAGRPAGATASVPPAHADARLIEQSLAEPERFAGLFDRYAEEIHRYAARRLGPENVSAADDVTAETFLAAFRKRGRYDLARPDARPWLYGIAANLIGKHRRTELRRLRALARLAEPVHEPFEQRSHDRVDAEVLRPALAAALAALSRSERELFLLVAWAELSYEQAAQALGIPLGTVRSRLSRTRAKIRRVLEAAR